MIGFEFGLKINFHGGGWVARSNGNKAKLQLKLDLKLELSLAKFEQIFVKKILVKNIFQKTVHEINCFFKIIFSKKLSTISFFGGGREEFFSYFKKILE